MQKISSLFQKKKGDDIATDQMEFPSKKSTSRSPSGRSLRLNKNSIIENNYRPATFMNESIKANENQHQKVKVRHMNTNRSQTPKADSNTRASSSSQKSNYKELVIQSLRCENLKLAEKIKELENQLQLLSEYSQAQQMKRVNDLEAKYLAKIK